MTLQERIDQLDDFTLLKFFNHFTANLVSKLNSDLPAIVTNVPDPIRQIPELDRLLQADGSNMGAEVQTSEAVVFARQTLSYWANDPHLAPTLDDMLTNYRDTEQAAGVLLELGGAVSMILVMATSSAKRDKDGKWVINILGLSAEDIDARTRLVKMLLSQIPQTLGDILKMPFSKK